MKVINRPKSNVVTTPKNINVCPRVRRNYSTEENKKILEKTLIKEDSMANDKLSFKETDNPDWRGKFYIIDPKLPEKTNIRQASLEEVNKANIFCYGGLYATNNLYHASLVKGLLKLVDCKTISEANSKNIYPVVFQYPLNKKEHFLELIKYNINKSYFSPWMLDFADKHIIPRFNIDSWVGRLIGKAKPLTDFTFSAGARDARMIENATTHLLRTRYNLNDRLIKKYNNFRKGVDFGYALDIADYSLPKVRFQRKTVFGYDDNLSLLPKSFAHGILAECGKDLKEDYFVYFENDRELDESNTLILLSKNRLYDIIDYEKITHFGHSYPHYIESTLNVLKPSVLAFLTHDLHFDHKLKLQKTREMIR